MTGYAGGTAAADIARLRRYVAEPGTATYTDATLIAELQRYPLPDSGGNWPFLLSGSVNPNWTGTFDHAATAADIWEEKASGKAGNFAFAADGATYHKDQVYAQYRKEASRWRSRRHPGTYTAVKWPTESIDPVWIANLPEPD